MWVLTGTVDAADATDRIDLDIEGTGARTIERADGMAEAHGRRSGRQGRPILLRHRSSLTSTVNPIKCLAFPALLTGSLINTPTVQDR
jgi:hypothetical protein